MAYFTLNATGGGTGAQLTTTAGNVSYSAGSAGDNNYGVVHNDGRAPITVGLTVANINAVLLRQGLRTDGAGRPKGENLTITSGSIVGIEVPAQGTVVLQFTNTNTSAAAWRVNSVTSSGHNETDSINSGRHIFWG